MSLLPDIGEDGQIIEQPKEAEAYKPPIFSRKDAEIDEERLRELNNHGRAEITDDFSDSRFLQ